MRHPSCHHRISALVAGALLVGCMPSSEAASDNSEAGLESEEIVSASGQAINLAALDRFIDAQMSSLAIPGVSVAVIADGKVVYNEAKGVVNANTKEETDSDSVFEAASLSKPVFAYFMLKLADRGVIDLDRPLYQYRPLEGLEKDTSYHVVTARMALSHQTGFPNWRWFDPAPPERGIERGTMYMKRQPGEFGYSGEGYNYLSLVAADLTGNDQTSLDDLYQKEIAIPLGLSCSSFIKTPCIAEHKVTGHKDGKPHEKAWPQSFPEDTPLTFGAAGRLHTNALDYAKIMVAMMEGQALSHEMSELLFAEQAQVPLESDSHKATGVTAWSVGLGIEPTQYGKRYEHGGNNGDFQSGMMFFRDKKLGYVFLTNSDRGVEFNRRMEACITDGVCE